MCITNKPSATPKEQGEGNLHELSRQFYLTVFALLNSLTTKDFRVIFPKSKSVHGTPLVKPITVTVSVKKQV